jgi:hypothetical protein
VIAPALPAGASLPNSPLPLSAPLFIHAVASDTPTLATTSAIAQQPAPSHSHTFISTCNTSRSNEALLYTPRRHRQRATTSPTLYALASLHTPPLSANCTQIVSLGYGEQDAPHSLTSNLDFIPDRELYFRELELMAKDKRLAEATAASNRTPRATTAPTAKPKRAPIKKKSVADAEEEEPVPDSAKAPAKAPAKTPAKRGPSKAAKPPPAEKNPCNIEGEDIAWITVPATNTKPAESYPVVMAQPYNARAAALAQEYLDDRYKIDEDTWVEISRAELPLDYQDRLWWRAPTDHEVPETVFDASPHIYIWMMGARYEEGVAPAYNTQWDTFKDLKTDRSEVYFPPDGKVPPRGLLQTGQDVLKDLEAFHGGRRWTRSLARPRKTGGAEGWFMPSLLEVVRTHPALESANPAKYAGWPIFYILTYLQCTRSTPGYYTNEAFEEFTKDGSGNSERVPLRLRSIYLADNEDELHGGFNHHYTPDELYWILTYWFRIKPELAFSFVKWAIQLPGSDKDHTNPRAILDVLLYLTDKGKKNEWYASFFERHPGQVVPGLLIDSPSAIPAPTLEDLNEWREHCWEEEATAAMRQIIPAVAVQTAPEEVGNKLEAVKALPLVNVKGDMFDPANFWVYEEVTGPPLTFREMMARTEDQPLFHAVWPLTPSVEHPLRLSKGQPWPPTGKETTPEEKAAAAKRAAAQASGRLQAALKPHASEELALVRASRQGENPAPVKVAGRPRKRQGLQSALMEVMENMNDDLPMLGSLPADEKAAVLERIRRENNEVEKEFYSSGHPSRPFSQGPLASLNLDPDVVTDAGGRHHSSEYMIPGDHTSHVELLLKPGETNLHIMKVLKNRDAAAEASSMPPPSAGISASTNTALPAVAQQSRPSESTSRPDTQNIKTISPEQTHPIQTTGTQDTAAMSIPDARHARSSEAQPQSNGNSQQGLEEHTDSPKLTPKRGPLDGTVDEHPRKRHKPSTDTPSASSVAGADKAERQFVSSNGNSTVVTTTRPSATKLGEFAKTLREAASSQTATETPAVPDGENHPYPLWDPSERDREYTLSFGKHKLPNLDDGTPLYDTLCDLQETDKAFDPPPMVHLSCKHIQRLYNLVRDKKRSMDYLADNWPHVFDTKGAVHRHRHPQGEPALLTTGGEPAFAVAHKNYVLMGGAAYAKYGQYIIAMLPWEIKVKGKKDRKIPWSTSAYIKNMVEGKKNLTFISAMDTKEAQLYVYNQELHHVFAHVIDPYRTPPNALQAILTQADAHPEYLYLVEAAATIDLLMSQHNVPLPREIQDYNLSPRETSKQHFGISLFTLRQRYIQKARLNLPFCVAQVPQPLDLEVLRTRLFTDTQVTAGYVHTSQRLFERSETTREKAEALIREADLDLEESQTMMQFLDQHKQSYQGGYSLLQEDAIHNPTVTIAKYEEATLDHPTRRRWLEAMPSVEGDQLPYYHEYNMGEASETQHTLTTAIKDEPDDEEDAEGSAAPAVDGSDAGSIGLFDMGDDDLLDAASESAQENDHDEKADEAEDDEDAEAEDDEDV